jgi:hypothetical protein
LGQLSNYNSQAAKILTQEEQLQAKWKKVLELDSSEDAIWAAIDDAEARYSLFGDIIDGYDDMFSQLTDIGMSELDAGYHLGFQTTDQTYVHVEGEQDLMDDARTALDVFIQGLYELLE